MISEERRTAHSLLRPAVPAVAALVLLLAAVFIMSMVTEPEDETRFAEFLPTAFGTEARVARHQRLGDDWLFGDPSSVWEVRLPGGLQAEAAGLGLLSPGQYAEDKKYFASELARTWPDVWEEELRGYSFFRGGLPLASTMQSDSKCEYYVLNGPERAFINVFCN